MSYKNVFSFIYKVTMSFVADALLMTSWSVSKSQPWTPHMHLVLPNTCSSSVINCLSKVFPDTRVDGLCRRMPSCGRRGLHFFLWFCIPGWFWFACLPFRDCCENIHSLTLFILPVSVFRWLCYILPVSTQFHVSSLSSFVLCLHCLLLCP